jgi:hypothetical protein
VGQKAPKGPASHPLGIETDVGRQKSAALIYSSLSFYYLEVVSSASPRFFDSFFIKEKRMPCGEQRKAPDFSACCTTNSQVRQIRL